MILILSDHFKGSSYDLLDGSAITRDGPLVIKIDSSMIRQFLSFSVMWLIEQRCIE
jgi:hypothetical protein